MEDNKKTVKLGVRDFSFAQLDESGMVKGKPRKVPGLRKATLGVTVNQEDFYGDDGVHAILDSGISEVTLDIEVADLSSEDKKLLFGIEVEDGIEIYKKDLQIPYVACSFRTTTNEGAAVWYGLPKGKFTLPTADLNGNQGSPNANPDTITGRFEENNNGRMYYIGREDNEDYKEETFKKKVFPSLP